MLKLDFIILISLLLVIAYLTGRVIQDKFSRGLSRYWTQSLLLIIAYSLIEGLRYLRGVDYSVYVDVFLGVSDRPEFLFGLLNDILGTFGVHFSVAFIAYSFIWIICLLIFLKEHKAYLALLLPLMIISNWYYSENFIRQYLAFSFNLISINYFLYGRWKKFMAASIIAVCFHTIAIAYVGLIIINCFYKKTYPIIITIPLYISFFVLSSGATVFSSISQYADLYLSSQLSGSRFEGYVENSDRWFGEDAISKDRYEKSTLSQIGMVIFDLLLMLYGYKILQNKPDSYWIGIYNLFVYGAVFFQLFMNIEILRRFAFCFYAFWPMMFVLVCNKWQFIPKYLLPRIGMIYLIIYITSYQIIKNIYLSNGGQLFIWDMGTNLERIVH